MSESLGIIPFGELAPDLPAIGNAGVERAENCLPRARGYSGFPALVSTSDALVAKAVGAVSARNLTASPVTANTYAGTLEEIYSLGADGTWTVVSKGAVPPPPPPATYNQNGGGVPAARYWQFVQWANTIIGTNLNDPIQTIALGGTNFADLTTDSDYRGRHIAVIRNQVVIGYVYDVTGTTEYPARLHWSGFNDPTTWTPSRVTLADFQDLRGNGGAIQAITGGTVGMVFQEKAIWRMEFIGAPWGFQIDLVEEAVGALAPRSVIRYGNKIFFLAEDGFRMITPNIASRTVGQGEASALIGEERIDREFLADLDENYLDNVTAVVDPANQLIIWSYPGRNSLGGEPNRLLMYNIASNKWVFGDEAVDLLFTVSTVGVDVDDTNINNQFASVDDASGNWDDPQYTGGATFVGAIDDEHKAASFTGTTRTATIETGEVTHSPGRRSFVNNVRPLVDGGTTTIAVGTRNRQTDSVVFTGDVTENAAGRCPVRTNARYHRYRVTISGDFTDAIGIEPYGRPAGRR